MTFSVLFCHSTDEKQICNFSRLCDVWSLLKALEVNYPLSYDQEKLLMIPGYRQGSGLMQHEPFLLLFCFTVLKSNPKTIFPPFYDHILSVSANLESYIVARHKLLRSSPNLSGSGKCDDLGPFQSVRNRQIKLDWNSKQGLADIALLHMATAEGGNMHYFG